MPRTRPMPLLAVRVAKAVALSGGIQFTIEIAGRQLGVINNAILVKVRLNVT